MLSRSVALRLLLELASKPVGEWMVVMEGSVAAARSNLGRRLLLRDFVDAPDSLRDPR